MTSEPPENHVPNEREKFYDEHIAPELSRLSKLCLEKGLPFLAIVEFNSDTNGESEFGRTFAHPRGASESFRWFDVFARCNANFERYCMTFTKHVIENDIPHSSIYLMQLGIKPNPKDRKEQSNG